MDDGCRQKPVKKKDRTMLIVPVLLLPFAAAAVLLRSSDVLWAGLVLAFGGLLLLRGLRNVRHPEHCENGNEKFWSSSVIAPWMSLILGACMIALAVYMLIVLFVH